MTNKKKHQRDILNFFDLSPSSMNVDVEVTEHRAPTDQSVKLLNEMQEKARENIIAAVKISDNTLNGVALMYVDGIGMGIDQIHIDLQFNVNGKQYFFKQDITDYRLMLPTQSEQELTQWLGDKLKAVVANYIFQHLQVKILETLSGKDLSHITNSIK